MYNRGENAILEHNSHSNLTPLIISPVAVPQIRVYAHYKHLLQFEKRKVVKLKDHSSFEPEECHHSMMLT